MSLTPLNRSLHIYLFRFVDSYLSIFLVIVPWSNTSAGGCGGGDGGGGSRQGSNSVPSSTDTPRQPPTSPCFSSPFKATPSWKAHLPRNLWDHFKFSVRVKELTFWKRSVSESTLEVERLDAKISCPCKCAVCAKGVWINGWKWCLKRSSTAGRWKSARRESLGF